ncbi:DNA-3-methyladenine glycosylase family protein [Legionella jordanis]|uniref:DNA-3-methyladenine glycosylase II n=1 Tax=Legionella jordanis TaxID=456 RepID=A0A0W0V7X8_9GAMM|nr:DNA-3-methyladenine glycosylase [Legionella jordanis]KTD16224.1 DNA-3-methyladenine glycosylase [Legionella jordanis]RMX04556.1 DNA-3-methyladenine glycosylase 2 family protein [Legionella jordanis]VEH12318.1 DNA-3-methyladenine glycosylase [Legionella jordanis]
MQQFQLIPMPPFRLDYTVAALRRRIKNIVDCWDGQSYSRLFLINSQLTCVKVSQDQNTQNAHLMIECDRNLEVNDQSEITQVLERLLGLNKNLEDFYFFAGKNKPLSILISRFMGLKPPQYPSLFEALVNAISCQQISLDAGLEIQNRLIQFIDLSFKNDQQAHYVFPEPIHIANCSIQELKQLGYSKNKSETLKRLANAFLEKPDLFAQLRQFSNDDVIHFLCQFKGIGRWTAEYVLLRGLGRLEVFPRDDVGAQNNLHRLLKLEEKPDANDTAAITASWHPYAGLIYFHLLLQRLFEKSQT